MKNDVIKRPENDKMVPLDSDFYIKFILELDDHLILKAYIF